MVKKATSIRWCAMPPGGPMAEPPLSASPVKSDIQSAPAHRRGRCGAASYVFRESQHARMHTIPPIESIEDSHNDL